MRSCTIKKALRACRGAERTVGSGSGACGVVRGVTTPFLRADPVYQQAADARSSGCIGVGIGVGGDAQGFCGRRKVKDWERIASFPGLNISYDLNSGILTMDVKSKIERLFEDHSMIGI